MNTIELQIENINEQYNRTINEINLRREYRMKNYYDCVDDYSWGGLCDKADNMSEDNARRFRDIRIEEVKNGGTHKESTVKYVLADVNGNIVANTIHSGRFGNYWIDESNNKCIGVPKKMSTLLKKGYTLIKITNVYDCVIRDINMYGHIINNSMVLISSVSEKCDTLPEYIPFDYPFADWLYETKFAA